MPSTLDTGMVGKDTAGPPRVGAAPTAARGVVYVWAVTRISLGWVFLWGFLDKAFGLGVDTPAAEA